MIRRSNLTAQIESQKNTESNPNCWLPNRIFRLSNHSRLGFAHHWSLLKVSFSTLSLLELWRQPVHEVRCHTDPLAIPVVFINLQARPICYHQPLLLSVVYSIHIKQYSNNALLYYAFDTQRRQELHRFRPVLLKCLFVHRFRYCYHDIP